MTENSQTLWHITVPSVAAVGSFFHHNVHKMPPLPHKWSCQIRPAVASSTTHVPYSIYSRIKLPVKFQIVQVCDFQNLLDIFFVAIGTHNFQYFRNPTFTEKTSFPLSIMMCIHKSAEAEPKHVTIPSVSSPGHCHHLPSPTLALHCPYSTLYHNNNSFSLKTLRGLSFLVPPVEKLFSTMVYMCPCVLLY